jgi:hypothetical protein
MIRVKKILSLKGDDEREELRKDRSGWQSIYLIRRMVLQVSVTCGSWLYAETSFIIMFCKS